MAMPNKKPVLKKADYPLSCHFGLEPYEASFSIDDLKSFALTQNKEKKRSMPNWIEAWFEGFDWPNGVKHDTEYDRLSKKSPLEFMEWLDKQSEDGNSFVKCRIFKDLKEGCLRMTWIEGVDMEVWHE